MKKSIIFMLICISTFALGTEQGDITFEPKIGVQVNVVLDNVHLFDFEAAKFVTLDVFKRVSGRLDLGLGIQWNEVETTRQGADAGTMTRLPIYAIAKLHLAQTFFINPYLKVLGGYQLMLEDAESGMGNGAYYGAGIGLELADFVLDYAYTAESNEGDTEVRGAIGHALSLGYRF